MLTRKSMDVSRMAMIFCRVCVFTCFHSIILMLSHHPPFFSLVPSSLPSSNGWTACRRPFIFCLP